MIPEPEDIIARRIRAAADVFPVSAPDPRSLAGAVRHRRRQNRTLAVTTISAAVIAIIVLAVTLIPGAIPSSTQVEGRGPNGGPPPTGRVIVKPRPRTSVTTAPPTTVPTASTTTPSTTSTSTTSTSTSTTTSTTVPGIQLTSGPYGFEVPQGWTEHPKAGAGGSAEWASFVAPDGQGAIYALFEGGDWYGLYTASGVPDPQGAVGDTSCGSGPNGPSPTSTSVVNSDTVDFVCASSGDLVADGKLVIGPYNTNRGYVQLEVELPSSDQADITTILGSLG